MSADNYALVGIHPLAGIQQLAGTDEYPSTLHGVYVGFKSSDHQPSAIPPGSKAFNTHAEAAAYAEELETEYGVRFLCNCTSEDEQVPPTKKTVRRVIQEYADTLNHIYSARSAGDFTWKGLLHEFMEEIAMSEDE